MRGWGINSRTTRRHLLYILDNKSILIDLFFSFFQSSFSFTSLNYVLGTSTCGLPSFSTCSFRKPFPLDIWAKRLRSFTVKVPLKVASRVYAICNPSSAVHGAIPFLMGAYYATYYYQCNSFHMAQYFDVRCAQLQWINGRHHPQSEPVLPSHRGAPYLDCRPIRHHRMPANCADAYTLTCPPCLTKRPSI